METRGVDNDRHILLFESFAGMLGHTLLAAELPKACKCPT